LRESSRQPSACWSVSTEPIRPIHTDWLMADG
jgi:hypothetical protein